MMNWKSSALIVAVLAMMWTAPAAHAQSPQPPPNSAKSSPSSDTRVVDTVPGPEFRIPSKKTDETSKSTRNLEPGTRDLIPACMATAVELEKTRGLVTALENENRAVKERLETEKRTTTILTELNETRKNESDALRSAITAQNETIMAKDAVIASQDKLIAVLKQKKTSPWRRLGDVLIGAAIFAILK